MNLKTIQTFKDMSKRSSIYLIFDNATTKHNPQKVNLEEHLKSLSEKDDDSSSSNSSNSESNTHRSKINSKSMSQRKNSFSKNNMSLIKNKLSRNLINKELKQHKYQQNRLPVLTNSLSLLKEIKNISDKDEYYKKFSENNYGEKYSLHNPVHEEYSKETKEYNILRIGLINEEKNPCDIIDKKNQGLFSNTNFNKISNSYKYNSLDYPLLNIIKNYNKNHNKPKNLKMKDIKNNTFYSIKDFSYAKKDEFSNYLIMEYIKNNYPSILNNNNNTSLNSNIDLSNNKSPMRERKKYLLRFLGKKIETRKIYIIKDSTVISNPKIIPGLVTEIPSNKFLKSLKKKQRFNLMKQFLKLISIRFRVKLAFNFIFDKNGNLIFDFLELTEKDKYIFVSPVNIFQGILISMHKGIMELYLKYFSKGKKDNFCFNESSLDESSKIIPNNKYYYLHSDKNDDVYDMYFSNNLNYKKKLNFKKVKKTKTNKKNSFTFGIDDNDENNYEYLYYSDNEKKRKNIINKIYKNCENKMDYYIATQNVLYDKKINELKLKLSENKPKHKIKMRQNSNKTKKYSLSQDIELRDEYLTEKKIKNKDLIKEKIDNKLLSNQDIIDTFNILQNKDSTFDIKKFYIQKNIKKNFIFLKKNIKDNTNKYSNNRRKAYSIYPSLFTFNIPETLEKYPKYSLDEIIRYYTKFRALVNLWFNLYNDVDLLQYGIDFDTFHNCNDEICDEVTELAKIIYEKINTSPSGILSFEDYIESLNGINQKDTINQFKFFLKIWKKDKKFFSYEEVLKISMISIKKLVKNNTDDEDKNILKDLAKFFAKYIFNLCDSNIEEGIKIEKLKELLNSKGEKLDYLKLFLGFRDDMDKNEIVNIIKKKKENEKQKQKNNIS